MGNRKLPPIVWLRVTDFIHAWLQHELSGELMVKDQRVVCVQHLEGAREVFRMTATNDIKEKNPVATSLSAVKRNCIAEGINLDEETVKDQCRVLKEDLRMFVPIECPRVCMTQSGVLRPWTLEITFGRSQANAMQQLLREAFWDDVEEYSRQYAKKMNGAYYPQIDMIEDFCVAKEIPDEFVADIRREWQRRLKRGKNNAPMTAKKEPENVNILNL